MLHSLLYDRNAAWSHYGQKQMNLLYCIALIVHAQHSSTTSLGHCDTAPGNVSGVGQARSLVLAEKHALRCMLQAVPGGTQVQSGTHHNP